MPGDLPIYWAVRQRVTTPLVGFTAEAARRGLPAPTRRRGPGRRFLTFPGVMHVHRRACHGWLMDARSGNGMKVTDLRFPVFHRRCGKPGRRIVDPWVDNLDIELHQNRDEFCRYEHRPGTW